MMALSTIVPSGRVDWVQPDLDWKLRAILAYDAKIAPQSNGTRLGFFVKGVAKGDVVVA
jgi:hypothetical protein